MKKIAIIELDYHFEVLLNSCRIFNNLEFDVTVITKEQYVIELSKTENFDNLKWITWKEDESLSSFWEENIDRINSFDLLIFNTFTKYFKEFLHVDLKPKTVLRIHNANAYFSPKNHLKLSDNPYYLLKDFKYLLLEVLLKKEWKYRELFREKVDCYTFPTNTIRDYAVSQNYIQDNQSVKAIPWSLASKEITTTEDKNEVYITLTGAVDIRRRDYKQLYKALEKAKDKFKNKVVLTFLGKPKNDYEKRTIKKFSGLECNKLEFVSYDKWVPQKDFDNIMQRTDFLVIPLYKVVKFTIYGELYGYTKISGNVNDIVLYARPALISSFYPLEETLKNVTESFEDTDELVTKLIKWVNEKTFMNYQKHLIELQENYSLKKIQEEVKNIITSITL